MSAVTIAEAWPNPGEPFTVDDLEKMPDDGHSVLRDLNLKRAAYERFGIGSYWVIDPDLDRPSLRAFELDGDCYTEVAHVTGGSAFRADRPFSVQIVPDRLVAKLRPR